MHSLYPIDIRKTVFNAICAILVMGSFVALIAITMFTMAGVQFDHHHSTPAISTLRSPAIDGTLLDAIPPGPEAEVSGTFYETVAADFSADGNTILNMYTRRHQREK